MVLVPWPVLTEKSIDIGTVGIKVYSLVRQKN